MQPTPRQEKARSMRFFAFVFAMALLWTSAASAHSYKLGAIEIGHPWAAPASGDSVTINLALANEGNVPDSLVGASSLIAKTTSIEDAGGKPLASVALDPHHPVALRPGHAHITLKGLSAPLKANANFPVTLRFAKAGEITITVMVESVPTD